MLHIFLGWSQGALSLVICLWFFVFWVWLTVYFYSHGGSAPWPIFGLGSIESMWLKTSSPVKRSWNRKPLILTLIIWHLNASGFISIWNGVDSKFVLFWGASRVPRRWCQSSTCWVLGCRWPFVGSIANLKVEFRICASVSRCDLVVILEDLLVHDLYLRICLLGLNRLDWLRFISINQNWYGLFKWLWVTANELLVALNLSLRLLNLSLQVLGFLEIVLNLR